MRYDQGTVSHTGLHHNLRRLAIYILLEARTYDQLTIPLQYGPRFVLPAHDMMADCLLLE